MTTIQHNSCTSPRDAGVYIYRTRENGGERDAGARAQTAIQRGESVARESGQTDGCLGTSEGHMKRDNVGKKGKYI